MVVQQIYCNFLLHGKPCGSGSLVEEGSWTQIREVRDIFDCLSEAVLNKLKTSIICDGG
jgi:hypothetical protein